jgi:hypothetical protein
MKLFGTIAVHVAGEEILRKPGFLDKAKKFFGGTPDLRTGKVKASIEAAAIVDSIRDALRSIGVSNAVALIVDDITLFHDREGRPDDLGDMFLAFHEQSSALGGGFDMLRLTVEHEEAGLHLVMEVQAKSEHAPDEPAVRVIVSGRMSALEPRPSESADAYRARIEPLTKDRTAIEVATIQFEGFVARVRDAIQKAMPEARAEVVVAEARIEKPAKDGREREPVQQRPDARYYDPYDHYYPSPLGSMLSIMMWSSIFSMAMMPNMMVVNHYNQPMGHADDPGVQQADPDHDQDAGDHGGDHDGGDGGDVGGDGYDAGDMGGDVGGGDFGGGDFGGDFGGFD